MSMRSLTGFLVVALAWWCLFAAMPAGAQNQQDILPYGINPVPNGGGASGPGPPFDTTYLRLDGTNDMSGQINAEPTSSCAAPAVTFSGDPDTGMAWDGATTLSLCLAGTTTMTSSSTGFVFTMAGPPDPNTISLQNNGMVIDVHNALLRLVDETTVNAINIRPSGIDNPDAGVKTFTVQNSSGGGMTLTSLGNVLANLTQNAETAVEVRNASTGAAAGAGLFLVQDGGAGKYASFEYLSEGFATSGLQTASQGKFVTASNATGGWLFSTLGAAAPIVFGQGGIAAGNERMRVSSGGVSFSNGTVTSNSTAWSFPSDTTVSLGGGVDGINFDSNTLSIDATNNRVGFGTASPATTIDVVGTAAVSSTLSAGAQFQMGGFQLRWMQAVVVVATSNVSVATGIEAGDTIDGITLAAGDRVALIAQSSGSEEGIYLASSSGAASRSTDLPAGVGANGIRIPVSRGTANAGATYRVTSVPGSDVVGTDNLSWSGAGIFTSGNFGSDVNLPRLVYNNPTSITCASTGTGAVGAQAIDPSVGLALLTNSDPDGCVWTFAESGATLGAELVVVIVSDASATPGTNINTFPNVANVWAGQTLCTTTGLNTNGNFTAVYADEANDKWVNTACTQP